MDLKFYNEKTILHLIDHATCPLPSTAVHIPSKHPKVIVHAILKQRISVYGAAGKFLSQRRRIRNEEFLICVLACM